MFLKPLAGLPPAPGGSGGCLAVDTHPAPKGTAGDIPAAPFCWLFWKVFASNMQARKRNMGDSCPAHESLHQSA